MSVMKDAAFQERILALATRDRKFLQKISGIVTKKDFSPTDSEKSSWARFWAAQVILNYYRTFKQPVGGMLRAEVLELIRENKKDIGELVRKELLSLTERLNSPELVTAPESIETKLIKFKQRQRMRTAINDLIELQGKGELTPEVFTKTTRDAFIGMDGVSEVVDYGRGIDQRIERRLLEGNRRQPYLLMECVDAAISTAPRGQIQMALAKYGTGKSTFMVHVAKAYALQGFNVLFYTLEDPVEIVENRLDASIALLPLDKLWKLPYKTKRKFTEEWVRYKANIQIVNATGGGWTVERMAGYWESMRNRGFTADLVIIDYDKKIEPPRRYKGENAPTLQSTDIVMELGNWAARDQIYMWVAAQAKRGPMGKNGESQQYKMIVTGDDVAEDVNKMREAGLCIGIGFCRRFGENGRYLYIAKNRFGRQFIGWPVMGDFTKSVFYEVEESRLRLKEWENQKEKKVET